MKWIYLVAIGVLIFIFILAKVYGLLPLLVPLIMMILGIYAVDNKKIKAGLGFFSILTTILIFNNIVTLFINAEKSQLKISSIKEKCQCDKVTYWKSKGYKSSTACIASDDICKKVQQRVNHAIPGILFDTTEDALKVIKGTLNKIKEGATVK